MLTDIDKEFDTPIEDENGELIETIEEDDVFIEEDLGLEEQPDSFYEVEDDIVIEGEEEEEIYSIQEVTVEAKENYENVKEQLVAIFTSILEKGEITAEDNIEIEQLKEEYTQAYNDIKENVEDEQNKALEERVQELEDGMVGSKPDEILAILTDNGRKPWLYTDEDNNVLMDGTAIPELTVLAQKLSLIATDGDDESSIVLTPTMIQMIAESDIQLSAKKILINGLLEGKGWRVTEEGILDIKELNAVKATIGTLEADEIIADIIHGNTADIGDLTADIGKIETLVGGNLTMDNIASLILTSKKVTVEDAFIKNAMIDSVSAAKINTGILNTNLVNIQSEDGSLVLNGTLQQFKDENGKVRIQMGKDAQGNFTFGLFDETGIGTLINSNGITEKAIGDGLIVDKMIGENANISGSKLDISSVVTKINDGTTTIKSNKVKLDETNQTLDVAFNSLNTTVTEQGKAVGSHTTSINVMKGQIGTLISDTEIIEEGNKVTVKDAYSKLNIKVNEFGVSLKDVESDFRNMEIGGSNILDNADFQNDYTSWNKSHSCNHYIITGGSFSNLNDKAMKVEITANQTYAMMTQTHTLVPNQKYTVSCYMLLDGTFNLAKAGIRLYYMNNGWNTINAYSFITTEQLGKWTKLSVTFTPNSTYPETVITFGLQGVASQFCYVTIPQLEKGTVATDFQVKSSDITSSLNTLGTRVKNAETKLTLDGLTTIIGSTYITPTQLNNKGYATTSDVTQSVNGWTAKFMESGGYNKLYNGDFRRGLELWNKAGNIDSVIATTLSCPDNMYGIDMPGQIGKTAYYCQEFAYDRIGKLTLSYWTYITTSGVNGTTNPYSNIQIVVHYTDGTKSFYSSKTPSSSNTWEKITFTINIAKRPNKITVELINRDTTKRLYFTNVMLEDGEIANAFTPNPNEVFDGITNISKNGIEVTATNAGTKTLMSADGFFLKNLNGTNLFKVDKNGLEMTGKVTSTSGKIANFEITENTLSGGNLGLSGPGATLNDIAIWAGNADPVRAPLAIYHDGELISLNRDNGYFTSLSQGALKISTDYCVINGNRTGLTIKRFDNKAYLETAPDLLQMWTNDPTYKQIFKLTEKPSDYSFTSKVNESISAPCSLYVANGTAVEGDIISGGSIRAANVVYAPYHNIPSSVNPALSFTIGGFGGSSIYGDTQGVAYLGNCIIVYGNYKFTNVTANSSMSATITFRVPFNSAPFISATVNTSTPHTSYVGATAVSGTQFNLTFHRTSATDTTVFWCAIGQRA